LLQGMPDGVQAVHSFGFFVTRGREIGV